MKRTLLSFLLLIFATGVFAQLLVYTPTLKSPDNGALYQSPNVTVSWNAITGSLGLQYQVQVDTTLNFNSPLKLDTTQVLLTGYTTHELIFGKKYYWRVRAIDLGQTSYWSAVREFTVYNNVILSKPAQNQADIVPNVYVEWKNTVSTGTTVVVTGVRYWDYQVDTTTQFNSPLLIAGTEPYAVLKAPTVNLRFGTKYYYRVRARHNLSTSNWCEPFGFTVVEKLTAQGPNDNATNQSIDVSLKWKAITGIKFYEYEVALDDAFSQLVLITESDTNVVKMEGLVFGQKYYWHVRARHNTDTCDWSTTRNFTVINTVLLKAPSDAQQNVDLKPIMQWTAQTGLVGYMLQIDSMPTFPNPVIDVEPAGDDITYSLTKKLEANKTYYWRMRAFSDGGITADTTNWSPTWSFTTTASTGLGETAGSSVRVYPNPASDKIFVKIESASTGDARMELVDLLGKTLTSSQVSLSMGSNLKEMRLENLGKGVYILRLTLNGQTLNHKVIVDR